MQTSFLKRLRQTPLFARLGPEDLAAIAGLLQREHVRAGSVLAEQAQPGSAAYFVESGELQARYVDPQGAIEEGDIFGPGDFFGETSLILGEPHDATIEATRNTTILRLGKDTFDRLIEERPSVLKNLQLRADIRRKLRAPRYGWQEPDEVVALSLHKHSAVLVRMLALPALALLVAAVAALYPSLFPDPVRISAAFVAILPAAAIIYLVVDHVNDNYIVTNKRVLHEEHIFAIRELRTEAPLHMIQDVQQLQAGPLAQLLNFGDLIIETAGDSGHVVFRQIPNPDQARNAIFAEIERVRSVARIEQRARIQSDLRRQFSAQTADEGRTDGPSTPAASEPEQRPPAEWASALRRAVRFFLPPLRYEEGDTITWHKHWIGVLRSLLVPTALITVATIIALALLYLRLVDWRLVSLGYGAVLIVLFPWWWWRVSDWQNDVYQVTTTRLIDVERRPLFLSEQRREASLNRVQNINLQIPGVIGRMLNYGSVTIETAGQGAFTFEYIHDPRSVQSEIFRRIEALQERQRQQSADRRRVELMDWFSIYDEIRHPDQDSADSQQRPQ